MIDVDEAEIARLRKIEAGLKDLVTLKELTAESAAEMAAKAGPMDSAILQVLARQARELVGTLSSILSQDVDTPTGQLVEIDRDGVYVWHGLEPLKWGDHVVLPGVPDDWTGMVTGMVYGPVDWDDVEAVLRRA